MTRLKDPGSALTHLAGAVLSLVGLIFLVYRAVGHGDAWSVVSFAVFGLSLIALYTASTVCHSLTVSAKATLALRKVDHMMIFLLIAGTYTPFCLVPLRGAWGWSLFGAIWGCAALGMGVKLFWMRAPLRGSTARGATSAHSSVVEPRWLSTAFYVIMGWLIVVAIYPLSQVVVPESLVWLVTGGLLYTVGAVLYATKWPNPWPGRFGFHEIWHLFVMAGSAAHFLAVLRLV